MEENVPPPALKVALVACAGTVIDVGRVRLLELELSAITAPPVGAAPLKAAVQVEDAPGFSAAGEQDRAVIAGAVFAGAETVMVPPVPTSATDSPEDDAAIGLAIEMEAVVAFDVNVAVTTATTPLDRLVELIPSTMQV